MRAILFASGLVAIAFAIDKAPMTPVAWDSGLVDGQVISEPGSLDPTFGDGGIVIASQGAISFAAGLAVRPNGRILLAGTIDSQFGLMQYRSDGQLDADFGMGGVVTTTVGDWGAGVQGMVLQPDGKAVLVGSFNTNSPAQDDVVLVRYLPSGDLDPTFGQGGIASRDLGEWEVATAIARQSDGRLVVTGWQGTGERRHAIVIRFLENGRPDLSFNGSGERVLPLAISAMAFDLAPEPDGSVTLVGQGGPSDPGHYDQDILLIRLRPNGEFDPLFGTQGVLQTDLGTILESGSTVARQPDGKLVVVGTRGLDRQIVALRYEPDGRLDTEFGTSGVAILELPDVVWEYPLDVVVQANGPMVVAGSSYSTTTQWDMLVLRLTADGQLDPRFGDQGRTVVNLDPNGDDNVRALALQPDGAIVGALQTHWSQGVVRFMNESGYPSYCWLPAVAKP